MTELFSRPLGLPVVLVKNSVRLYIRFYIGYLKSNVATKKLPYSAAKQRPYRRAKSSRVFSALDLTSCY